MFPLILMSIIQGLTEFLPVSSSGHLLFIQSLFRIKGINLALDVFLHLATFLVIIIYYFKDIKSLVLAFVSSPFDLKKPDVKLSWLIIIANIPTAIIAFFLDKKYGFVFEQLSVLLITWTVMAIFLIISDRIKEKGTGARDLTFGQGLFIGIVQGIAALPGISRSGSTIIAGLFLGMKREESARFSFLLGLPAMLGAFILEAKKISLLSIPAPQLLLSFGITLVIGLLAIVLLIKVLNRRKFKYFGFYLILMVLAAAAKLFL